MGIIDSFRKMKEKGQEHSTPPPKGHTIAEILQDTKKSHLLGELLRKDGQEDLAARVLAGKLEEADIHLLAEYRAKYSERIAQSEKIEKLLTEENIIEIARNHPDFAKIIDIVGPKKAINVIQSQLRELCFADEDRFTEIAQPIEAHDSYQKGAYKEANDKTEKMCKDMGIKPQEYLDVIEIEDPKEKKVALRKLAKGKHSNFTMTVNMIFGQNRRNLQKLEDSEFLLESSIGQLDDLKKGIGETLFLSVSKNDDMRDALSRELLSESAPVSVEPVHGFGEAKREVPGFNDAKFNSDWEAYKVRMDYENSNDYEKGYVQAKFIDDQQEVYRKKSVKAKGFWHSVLASFLEKKISSKIDTLK